MPPRHTYWTILFGGKPTAFRAATQEELLPTFKQIQSKHGDAVMMWFARGSLWRSEEEARAAFDRPKAPFRGSKPDWRARPRADRQDRPRFDRPRGPNPEWQNRGPKSDWRDKPPAPPPAPPKPRSGEGGPKQGDRPEWRDKPRGDRQDRPRFDRPQGPNPEWQNRGPKTEWRDKPRGDRQDKPRFDRPRGPKPEWQNRGPKPEWRDKPLGPPPAPPPAPPKPRSGEGEKPRSGEGGPDDRRGRDWRPGGAHKDPRDRFKLPRDVKRARFKQKLRRDQQGPRPPRKKKDEE